MVSRVGILVAVTAAALIIGVGVALAHVGIESTFPKSGAKLNKAPARVSVTFEEEIRSGTITVRAANGTVVSKGKGGRDPSNVRRLRVALKGGLDSGRYRVRWTIVAADGDTQQGTFRFTVR